MSIEDPFKGIAPGKQHVYYTLELMLVAEITGANPGKPWEPVEIERRKWMEMCWDRFGCYAEPWAYVRGNMVYECKEANDELHAVWQVTGRKGYWNFSYAETAAARMRKASDAKQLRYDDGRGNITRHAKYLVRIVKVTVAKVVEVMEGPVLLQSMVAPDNVAEFCASGMVGIEVNTPITELVAK